MKVVPLIIISLFLLNGLVSAQSSPKMEMYYDVTTAFSYQFNTGDESSVGSLTNSGGFFGLLNYGFCIKRNYFLASAYFKFHSTINYFQYKESWKKQNLSLDGYTSGQFYSTGLLFGGMVAIQDPGIEKKPFFYVYMQAGLCNTFLPDRDIEYHSEDQDGNIEASEISYEASQAIGSVVHIGIQADLFNSGNSTGNAKIGFLRERANIPNSSVTKSNGDYESAISLFDWNTMSLYLGFSMSF